MSIPKMGPDIHALRRINNPHIRWGDEGTDDYACITTTCYGEECGRSFHDADGNLVQLPQHFHMRESDPDGGWRIYGMAISDAEEWQLPDEIYSPSHW
jgi:hypothetical protein